MTVYATYLRAVGLIPCLCTLILCLASRGVDIASSVWLVTWSDHMSSGQQLVYNASYQLQDANYNISSPSIDNASRVSDGKMNSEAVLDQTRGYYIKGYAILGAIGSTLSLSLALSLSHSISVCVCVRVRVRACLCFQAYV